MLATSTRFKLKSWWQYPRFFIVTWRSVKQARRSKGVIRVYINPFSLRTLTVWKSREAMQSFRNNGAHLEAMKQSNSFGDIFSVSWETDEIPDWKEAIKRLDDK